LSIILTGATLVRSVLLNARRDVRLDLHAVPVEDESDDKDESDDEEPDQLARHPLIFFFTKFSCEAITAIA